MKFKLTESVKRLDDNNTYATYSLIDLKNLLQKDSIPKRIVYCPDTGIWLVADATMTYHAYMLGAANDAGLTDIDAAEDEPFGRYYYIPYKYDNALYLYEDFMQEFPEVRQVEVFDDFVLGSDEKAGNPGANIFFGLFKEHPIIPVIDIEELVKSEN